MRRLLIVLLVALVSGSAGAADVDGHFEAPCDQGVHRAFDFWLGDWVVHGADGRLAGHNRIRATSGGCVLTEDWQGAQGSSGHSLNFVDPGSGRWRQLWVSPGVVIHISGGRDGASMVLTGTIRYAEPAREVPFRGRWTPLDDGRVRQFFEEAEQSADGTLAWQTWFEGYYSKTLE